MLYLVSTPIGNLGDITHRAIETLKLADYILCEDTRHSKILLNHLQIDKPLKSFHKFNESFKEDSIILDLKQGLQVALISDAGTPGIADPGCQLVQRCIAEGIEIVPIPGPCAAIAALSCSGFETNRFQFLGFLPRKSGELKKLLQEAFVYAGTSICYESPFRLLQTLQAIHNIAPMQQIAVCRELTKKFEEIRRGTPQELISFWKDHTLKGEIVLLIDGEKAIEGQEWESLSAEEHVKMLMDQYNLSQRDAIKMAAEMRGVPKRAIYNAVITK